MRFVPLPARPRTSSAYVPAGTPSGTVASISRVNIAEEGASAASSAEYSAYINFEETDQVRLGMSVIVYTQADEPLDKSE